MSQKGLFLLNLPIIRFVFECGAFGRSSSEMTAAAAVAMGARQGFSILCCLGSRAFLRSRCCLTLSAGSRYDGILVLFLRIREVYFAIDRGRMEVAMKAKLPTIAELQKGLDFVMDQVITSDYATIEAYVEKLRD